MNGPDDSIYVSRQRNEQSRLRELLDRSFDHLSHGYISDLQEFFFKNRRSER